MTALPPLRYLTGADVAAAMPPLPERLALAEQTLRGLAGRAELPPKIGVHPRPAASFAHAMPALLPGDAADGSADRLGMKWVSGNPENNAAGLLGIYGVLVLNDPVTTAPIAILDAGPITAERTAATSGVAIRAFAPRVAAGGVPRAALIGAGVQGRSHVPVLGYVLPGVTLTVFDRDPVRAKALAALARETPGIGEVLVAASAREAIEGAGVVVTVASFVAPPDRQVMTNDWLAPDALVVPVDYATYCAAEVARDACAVHRRPCRAVPGQPRNRQLRRLPGPGGHDRGGARAGAAGRAGRDDPSRHGARRRCVRLRDPGRGRVPRDGNHPPALSGEPPDPLACRGPITRDVRPERRRG